MQSMIKKLAAVSSVALLFGVAGCTQRDEVAEQYQDLQQTRQEAMQEIREAHREAMQEIAEARRDLNNAIAERREELRDVEKADLEAQRETAAVVVVPETRAMGAGATPTQ
ncbi:hypothetical protein [Ramlibacter rhizophilus]|uniref:Uncharacterized protein n=1 Tax=Ramlibacter rhizophilus TaxID=1781167 RepID=A0A4Z0BEN1_9BURK|nr:hypothetical protein [Ramlibacter rhizophilus]TFY97786.1 hypothetical protein EZ242_15065 [Ramlibacter rhizophilus]